MHKGHHGRHDGRAMAKRQDPESGIASNRSGGGCRRVGRRAGGKPPVAVCRRIAVRREAVGFRNRPAQQQLRDEDAGYEQGQADEQKPRLPGKMLQHEGGRRREGDRAETDSHAGNADGKPPFADKPLAHRGIRHDCARPGGAESIEDPVSEIELQGRLGAGAEKESCGANRSTDGGDPARRDPVEEPSGADTP